MTDAVPVQLDTEFMSPGRVLKEINPDPAAAATSPDNVTKQPLDFRFSVSQLPSWAQKRVSVEEILFSTKKENYGLETHLREVPIYVKWLIVRS